MFSERNHYCMEILNIHFTASYWNHPPPVKPNVWSEIKSGEKCLRLKNYSYFVINTAVGVGHKGKRNEIDRVHIRYHLIPMDDNLQEPEVVSIYPNTISQTVGEITASQMIMRQLGAQGGVKANVQTAGIKPRLRGFFNWFKSSTKIKEYTLPYEILVANASGIGTRAMWEFYQVEGKVAIGQYDLQIFFRIPNKLPQWPEDDVIRDLYTV